MPLFSYVDMQSVFSEIPAEVKEHLITKNSGLDLAIFENNGQTWGR